nr:RecName: Full=Unknown protein 9 [Ginkgo biloba]
STDALSK